MHTTTPTMHKPTIHKLGDWLAARSGDEVMMMSATQGLYLGLNRMGARVWDLLDTVHDRDGLCARLVEEFDVSQSQCGKEMDVFLADLERYNAVVIEP